MSQHLADPALQHVNEVVAPKDQSSASTTGASATQFTGLTEGVWYYISCSGAFHLAGGSSPTATTGHPYFPHGGPFRMFLPKGVTALSILPASGNTETMSVWQAQL